VDTSPDPTPGHLPLTARCPLPAALAFLGGWPKLELAVRNRAFSTVGLSLVAGLCTLILQKESLGMHG
jgi:hypothetical protein